MDGFLGRLLGRAETEAHDPPQRAERRRLSERRQGRRKGVYARRPGGGSCFVRYLTVSGLSIRIVTRWQTAVCHLEYVHLVPTQSIRNAGPSCFCSPCRLQTRSILSKHEVQPCLVHGDLWGGNQGFVAPENDPVRGWFPSRWSR